MQCTCSLYLVSWVVNSLRMAIMVTFTFHFSRFFSSSSILVGWRQVLKIHRIHCKTLPSNYFKVSRVFVLPKLTVNKPLYILYIFTYFYFWSVSLDMKLKLSCKIQFFIFGNWSAGDLHVSQFYYDNRQRCHILTIHLFVCYGEALLLKKLVGVV